MATTKQVLTGSTDGKGIKITTTATAGNTIHTADAAAKDEIFAFASNLDTVDRTVTVEWGGATDPDDLLVKALVVPPKSMVALVPGLILTNSKVMKVFADAANKIIISGFVNRIT
jgi:hypothetical protein